jgi:hypothetical protein
VYPGSEKIVRWTVTDETVDPPVLTSPTAQQVFVGREGTRATVYNFPDDAEVVEDGEGEFHVLVVSDSPGDWAVFIKATEGVIASAVERWTITAPPFREAG